MKINLVVCVFFSGPSIGPSLRPSVVSFYVFSMGVFVVVSLWGSSWASVELGLFLFTKGKFLTNSFIQSKVNIIYSDISWASSIKT